MNLMAKFNMLHLSKSTLGQTGHSHKGVFSFYFVLFLLSISFDCLKWELSCNSTKEQSFSLRYHLLFPGSRDTTWRALNSLTVFCRLQHDWHFWSSVQVHPYRMSRLRQGGCLCWVVLGISLNGHLSC